MDLNEMPSDHIVVEPKMGCNTHIRNFDTSYDNALVESGINYSEVEKRCRKVEEKFVDLQIRNKDMELQEIRGKIRVCEKEMLRIEEQVKGLRKKKADLEGMEIVETAVDEGSVDRESDEESKIVQLMIENKVLECEKSMLLKELEDCKRKCKEFEMHVHELEERLSCEGKDGNFSGVKEDIKTVNAGGESNFGSETCSPDAVDSGMQIRGKRVKRQLDFCNERSYSQKMSPSTPVGPMPTSVTIIDVDSDHEPDIPALHGPCLQSVLPPSVKAEVGVSDTDRAVNEEDENSGEENDQFVNILQRKRDIAVVTTDDELEGNEVMPKRRALKIENSDNESEDADDENDPLVNTPKRKRDLTVITSDDELEENEAMPKRRAFKIVNSDNESEEDDNDDALPIKLIFDRVKSKSNFQSDDEDNIPISQLNFNRGQGSRSIDHCSQSHPRRRLMKCGKSAQTDRFDEVKNSPESLTKKYVEDEKSEEDDCESDDNLSDFIVDDNDVDGVEDELSEDGDHHSHESEEASDDNLGFGDIISRLQRRKDPDSEWVLQGDMLSDFGKNLELCMRAVCAVYRRQIKKERSWMEGDNLPGRGFNKYDVGRGSILADFLTDGHPDGDLVKTVEELQDYDPTGPEACRTLAGRYSNQLFDIYNNNEDPFFP